jgi:DNA-binding transcriptional MerR regulator
MADPRVPDKAYFRIGEVAEIADVEPYVLRFWETEFPSLKPPKTRSNRRTYSRKDVELVLQIRDLLYEKGFTIPGARKHLKRRGRAEGAAIEENDGELTARTRAMLAKIRAEADELLRLVED